MGGPRCLFFAAFTILLACSIADKVHKHELVKRQLPQRSASQRAFPLSRSRQFPPPEELDEENISEEEIIDPVYDDPAGAENPAPRFRGGQAPPVEDTPEDYPYTEAPQTTAPPSSRTPNRISAFNRNANRPRFGSNPQSAPTTTTSAPSLTTVSTARTRSRVVSAPAERIDVVADILNRTPPPRSSQRSASTSKPTSADPAPPVEENTGPAARRIGTGRTRNRSRVRARSSTTTTTTTTTTLPPPAADDYYYYYEDEEAQPIATTTTTTTARPPSLPRRPSLGRRPANARSSTTARPVKFDLDSQFQAPPDGEPVPLGSSSSTKRFTTSTTEPPGPGGIPAHLKGMYKPRADNRFIDYYRDPNRPRELKGFDLTTYPFYIRVPEEIDFNCDEMKDGYYASIPHHCQLFHYCFAGARYDFLCANYTLYDQTTFTCRFANNVDCESSASYYYRNDDLWKETTTIPPAEQKKKKVSNKDDDYEDYEDEEYYDDEEDEDRRPAKRRRNRRRKNRRKSSES